MIRWLWGQVMSKSQPPPPLTPRDDSPSNELKFSRASSSLLPVACSVQSYFTHVSNPLYSLLLQSVLPRSAPLLFPPHQPFQSTHVSNRGMVPRGDQTRFSTCKWCPPLCPHIHRSHECLAPLVFDLGPFTVQG